MPEAKKPTRNAVEPFTDERGNLRVDRPFDPAEARKLEEERIKEYERLRRERFG